jgi:hypothetical protein
MSRNLKFPQICSPRLSPCGERPLGPDPDGCGVGYRIRLFLMQAALHVGPLRTSQPFIVIVDPIVSIALSAWLFAEHFIADGAVLAVAATGFAVMCAGVVVLTQTAPATMKADIPGDPGGGGDHHMARSHGRPTSH